MKDYLLLFHGGSPDNTDLSAEELQQVMMKWSRSWQKSISSQLDGQLKKRALSVVKQRILLISGFIREYVRIRKLLKKLSIRYHGNIHCFTQRYMKYQKDMQHLIVAR